MRPSIVGLIVGIVLGFAAVLDGLEGFLLVAIMAAIGYIVGQVVEGRIDLTPYVGGGNRDPR